VRKKKLEQIIILLQKQFITVYFTINLEGITTLEGIFFKNNNLFLLYFSPLFNSENINEIYQIIYECDKLESVD